jgi:hypothetical protein
MRFGAAADFIDTHDGMAQLAGQGCLTVLGDTATMGRILSGKPGTANFRQTAPEIHVWPQFAAYS